jgi:hypothetical protein
MPGPLPKDPVLRQRRNKAATRALLPAETQPLAEYPALPELSSRGPWHPMAVRWWDDVWSSPMHDEFLRADIGALFRLVDLVDEFWKTHKVKIAGEIRLLEREFGLTPMARRRLEWTVAQVDEAKHAKPQRPARVIEHDPRGALDA